MKVQTSVSVEESLRNRVAEAAAEAGSSFSSMWSLLVELGFTVLQGESVVSAPVSQDLRMLEPDLEVFPAKPPKNKAAILGKRTKTCFHRNPPESFCKYCDGGA